MPKFIILLTISLVFFLNLPVPAIADTLEQAIADFQDDDFIRAQRSWQDLAAEDDLDALYNLGQMFHLGLGAPFSNTRAVEYFLTAAEGGHTAAQRELANIYFFSSATPEHQNAAIGWWQRAAAAGDGRSQYILGVLYFNGDVIPQNMALGFAWTLLAIDAGIAEAIQSETAMRGQLAPGDLAQSVERSRTLMTSEPNQAHYSLLVAEEASIRRGPPPLARVARVAEAQPEIETPAIDPEPETIEEPQIEDAPLKLAEAETSPAIEEIPEPEPRDQAADMVPGDNEGEAVSEQVIADSILESDQVPVEEAASDPVLEPGRDAIQDDPIEQATAEVIEMPAAAIVEVETPSVEDTPAEDTPVEVTPVEVRDLGDPSSALVDALGFEGQWRVQVTSFRLPENADRHWQDVNAKYPEIFAGLEKRIVRFDLGPERGVYYRLRVGPFESKEGADQKCQELVDAAMGCLVIWP